MNLNFASLSQTHVIIIIRLQKTEAMNLNFLSLPQVHVIIRLQKTEAMNLSFPSLSQEHVIIRLKMCSANAAPAGPQCVLSASPRAA